MILAHPSRPLNDQNKPNFGLHTRVTLSKLSCACTELMFHLNLGAFNFPLIGLRAQTKDGWLVTLGNRVLKVGDETCRLLRVVVHQFGQCVELVFRRYVQLQVQSVSYH